MIFWSDENGFDKTDLFWRDLPTEALRLENSGCLGSLAGRATSADSLRGHRGSPNHHLLKGEERCRNPFPPPPRSSAYPLNS